MQIADEQSYEDVINSLRDYIGKVEESVSDMQSAGQDCVDNTQGDKAAAKSNGDLGEALKKISKAVEDIQGIIQDMQEELDEMREAAEE